LHALLLTLNFVSPLRLRRARRREEGPAADLSQHMRRRCRSSPWPLLALLLLALGLLVADARRLPAQERPVRSPGRGDAMGRSAVAIAVVVASIAHM